jgi:hypothetical protein
MVVSMSQNWPVLLFSLAFFAAGMLWIAHFAPQTQAMLARHGEQDGIVDAFVWLNRLITRKPRRPGKPTVNPPPQR